MNAKVIALSDREPQRDTPSDEVLVAACAAQDQDALGRLYDRHQAVLWRFLSRLLHPGAPELDDLVQATFLEVWRSAPRFKGRSTVRTWILGIGHNLTRKHMRDRSRRRAALARWAEVADAPVTPEDRWQDRMLVERMQAALPTLSPELRAAFVLCDVEGVRGVDAAEILGVRPGTVWRRLHDARKRLRRALEGGS